MLPLPHSSCLSKLIVDDNTGGVIDVSSHAGVNVNKLVFHNRDALPLLIGELRRCIVLNELIASTMRTTLPGTTAKMTVHADSRILEIQIDNLPVRVTIEIDPHASLIISVLGVSVDVESAKQGLISTFDMTQFLNTLISSS